MKNPAEVPGPRRRGSSYVLVMGIALLVTVLGMGALAVTRVTTFSVIAGNDWDTAGVLAFSGTEHGIAALYSAAAGSPSNWRAPAVSGQVQYTKALGRGTLSWAMKDEVDGNMTADYLRPFRIYGIGRCRSVTRAYSVQVVAAGSPLPLLKTALYSSGAVTLTGTTQTANGPVSGAGNVALAPACTGSVEAATVSGTAAGMTVTTGASAKTLPSSTLFNDVVAKATAISYASLSGGKLQNCLLSAGSNPYGATNPSGIYVINLAANNNLTVTNCRVVGTLMILGANKNNVNVQGPNEMEPGSAGNAVLMLSGTGMSVTISGSTTYLREATAGVNLNPASTPYNGLSDTDLSDDYPPQYHGVIYVAGDSASSLTLNSNCYVVGTVVATCPVKTSNQTTLVQDPTIYANPPTGFATGDALVEVPGSWRWDTLP